MFYFLNVYSDELEDRLFEAQERADDYSKKVTKLKKENYELNRKSQNAQFLQDEVDYLKQKVRSFIIHIKLCINV